MDDPRPRRKRIRLPQDVYALAGQPFFITVCTAQRRHIFAHLRYAEATFTALLAGPLFREAECLAACLMPDHLHLLLTPTDGNLISLLNRWKSFTTNLLHGMGLRGPIWQRSFHDHALRRDEAVTEVAQYIVENPVRHELVPEWQTYPYAWLQGASPDP